MKLRFVFLSLGCLTSVLISRANPPALPQNINTNNVLNIANPPYNATNNGVAVNTTAIQSAINAAAGGGVTNGLSGGVVEIPAGTFLTGPLAMKSKLMIQLDTGAVLKFLAESNYPNATGAPAYPLAGTNLSDIVITGSGTIDGNGAGWWASNPPARPYMVYFSKCARILIEGVTLQNPPKMHIVFKNSAADVTVQGITINSPGNSPNTDGIDLIGTNCLVQNSTINAGDDNIALGSSSSSAATMNVVVTNCAFGTGHGMTIGSNTQGGVSNLTVINCSFNGTQYGIRMKTDNASSGGGGQGGVAQNLSYYNLKMTNILVGAIVIYSYYNEVGTPSGITPTTAASQTVDPVTGNTPVWRNITISNVTATVGSSGVAGIIWARTECPLTNITMTGVSITAPKSFDIYNAAAVTLADCRVLPTTGSTYALFNAEVTVTNSAYPGASPVSFDGISTNGYENLLSLYDAQASLTNTNVLDTSPVLNSGGTILTVHNDLSLSGASTLNFLLGTNNNLVAVAGSLDLGGTLNIADGGGFGPGTYTLFTYGSGLGGSGLTLGNAPAGFDYSFDTSTPNQVNLVVQSPAPPAPTNLTAVGETGRVLLTWSPSTGANSYNVKRSEINGGPYSTVGSGVPVTNFTDSAVINGVTYYYVVTALSSGAESGDSTQASAQAVPSLLPVSLSVQPVNGQLHLTWPSDHIGWSLQIQTNTPAALGTNWVLDSDAARTNEVYVPMAPANGSVFLRLVYP